MSPPLALDIDGTLTSSAGGIDPRAFEALRGWDAPVVLATGKAFPYPVALCHFMDLPERVIAENGGVVYADDEVTVTVPDADRPREAAQAFVDRGGDLGWGAADTVNRWRETEVAVRRDADDALLRAVAEEFGLDVVDTGYAYHLKLPGVEKGEGLRAVAATLGLDPAAFVAVGDSENDVSTFEVAGESFAVANADDRARAAADRVTDGAHMDGTLEALAARRDR
ncbi:phosphoglycolate phosphatase [Haloplanus pelagicus]|jgi:phosphoglycolate phosphatase (TIGR01487 family)|uniref:phosphoglycolate phosphatase n=1 Tax=Haloplanus pelagicus TaxID=2949995 RepID=UPI00203BE099|nr:phosphoglycolate phosphatase [Haloplanus sp. HW8-1]